MAERFYRYPEFVEMDKIESEEGTEADLKFRYSLTIPFKTVGDRYVVIIMKNPSVATKPDEQGDNGSDATVNKLLKAANIAGYDGIKVVNLFPYRAKYAMNVFKFISFDPDNYNKYMKENFEHVEEICRGQIVLFAWGTNTISKEKIYLEMEGGVGNIEVGFQTVYDSVIREVKDIAEGCAKKTRYAGLTKDGYPMHPLCRSVSIKKLAEWMKD